MGLLTIDLWDLVKNKIKLTGLKGNKYRRMYKILKYDGFKCVKCGSPKDLTIHHLYREKKHRVNSTYKIRQCITLCSDCHEEIHGVGRKRNDY